jgi:hypothetical protein
MTSVIGLSPLGQLASSLSTIASAILISLLPGNPVKPARKGFAELQGSARLQPQQVTEFPAEHMFAIVQFGLRPDASRYHIQGCAGLAAQFAFFSRADSSVLLTAINDQATSSVCSSKHGLILVPGRRLAVVLQGLRYHLGMAPASLG